MILSDLHMHTTFCDGKNSPEEMILSGLEKGFTTIGISGHSYTPFDESYCIATAVMPHYFNEVQQLKKKYKNKIQVLCGIEQDYYAEKPRLAFDYSIGSVHYVLKNGEYIPVDKNADATLQAVKRHYNGDFYAYAEDYYALVGDVLNCTKATIIGHFDLITKFNEGSAFFDETHPRYVAAYQAAVDKLIPYGKPFEVNTGAISRGYKTHAYPALPILEYIKQKGGTVVLASDSHAAETIGFEFEKCERVVRDMGFAL